MKNTRIKRFKSYRNELSKDNLAVTQNLHEWNANWKNKYGANELIEKKIILNYPDIKYKKFENIYNLLLNLVDDYNLEKFIFKKQSKLQYNDISHLFSFIDKIKADIKKNHFEIQNNSFEVKKMKLKF